MTHLQGIVRTVTTIPILTHVAVDEVHLLSHRSPR
jgi:hypothetical protein